LIVSSINISSLRRTEKEKSMNWLTQTNICPGLFYGTSAQDGFLIRIRTPGGCLNSQQGKAIASLMKQWGKLNIQVTNRANLQIRSVQTSPSLDIFKHLQNLGLASQNPRVDHLRNLMTSPTAGIDLQELIDTRPVIEALDYYIQNHPELAELPAKFSIGIDGGGAVGIGTRSEISWEHRYNEIQLSAVEIGSGGETEKIYFKLALGGNKQLYDTQILIAPDDCLSIVAAFTQVYLDYVQKNSPTAKKPRMKHLLQDWGIEYYLQQVNRQLNHPLRPEKNSPKLPPTKPYAHLGVHPQRQIGLSYIGVSLPFGELTLDQLLELIQLSEAIGNATLRLTPWQTILLPNIPDEQIPTVLNHLSLLELSPTENQIDAAIVACTGKPGCSSAYTETQSHAIDLTNYLNQHFKCPRPVNIHLTGCIKSCAQPSPAEITLLGTTLDQNGTTVEGYKIYIGDGKQSLKNQLCEVTATEMPSFIEKLLNFYQKHRKNNDESFGEFTKRLDVGNMKQSFQSTEV
jgi:ferredoxin-nitrite reductase